MTQPSSATCVFSEDKVATLFDGMSNEYDEIKDLWYAWLFSQLHYMVVRFLELHANGGAARALDVGCGTGFQSILLSMCGIDVEGIDIAQGLIDIARAKDPRAYAESIDLFESPFPFTQDYGRRIREVALSLRDGHRLGSVNYRVASATSIPFPKNQFDIVSCCGSTLSFINDYRVALGEIARVLRPAGVLILEVENKYNLDLLWPVLDSCLGDVIGFGQSVRTALRNLLSPRMEHITTDFPFTTHTGEVDMNIWLFSSRRLQAELEEDGLLPDKITAIHVATNLLPSVVWDSAPPSALACFAFPVLSALERIGASWPILRRLGCSTVYFCRKGSPGKAGMQHRKG